MNYRHAYHAGNFADVMKHALLTLVIGHMKKKDKPFFMLDTHAGTGMTDLGGEEAQKTGEYLNGIARLLDAPAPHPALAAYLDAVRALGGVPLSRYPGSPALMAHLARAGERLAFCELHPEDAKTLRANFRRDGRVKTHEVDGYTALKAMLPPKERRGVVLIDPPFEQRDEYARLVEALAEAHRRFATGTYMIWYPLKDPAVSGEFLERLAADGPPKTLALELQIMATDPMRMTGSGMIIVNPPFALTEKGADGKSAALSLLEWLAATLAQGPGARARGEWLKA
ncbi:MAG: 23S rRNA (adenine(2030)-N(6))-methyltransferase RlmJ [Alphaproteobacteria bacterium]|nr:23S rRNA (adenine(2030)-N(6))-methyltransferase RlmJ [Alphaproteobacteria bacterium]MDX5414942.1 23S rRNA (adenine(2030)-N(6))-methyltransferase RlmJ [Alphaproteobacteria bacterium]MDX5492123.1 23S rRNA (adenine(2030)-N(6))-methyltransferase RlmJ [Alphaproteobacteria bacterium]